MSWEQALLAACAVSTALLGWVTYKRGSRADDVLDVAANVKSTFEAQVEINDSLRQDVVRLRAAHQTCEDATNDLRRSLADAHLREDEQVREVARLKAIVNEHEVTIARHETTINNMVKAARER
jgi:hypothetical protein